MQLLVLTETDACCGPMAAAFLRDYSTSIEVVSAGRNPLQSIDSMLVEVMKECLIDLSGYQPRDLKSVDESSFDTVYECPDWPAPKTMEEFRKLRDFIKNEAYLFFRGI
jgi:protein-tyrosine-phosphatase